MPALETSLIRPLALALALLTPAFAVADTRPEVLAQASEWVVGRWTTQDGEPGGTMRAVMEIRADGTLVVLGEFWPAGASAPRADLGGSMIAAWRMEEASSTRLLLDLSDAWVQDGTGPRRPAGPHMETMDLGIQPDGSLYDLDGALLWQRQGS